MDFVLKSKKKNAYVSRKTTLRLIFYCLETLACTYKPEIKGRGLSPFSHKICRKRLIFQLDSCFIHCCLFGSMSFFFSLHIVFIVWKKKKSLFGIEWFCGEVEKNRQFMPWFSLTWTLFTNIDHCFICNYCQTSQGFNHKSLIFTFTFFFPWPPSNHVVWKCLFISF